MTELNPILKCAFYAKMIINYEVNGIYRKTLLNINSIFFWQANFLPYRIGRPPFK